MDQDDYLKEIDEAMRSYVEALLNDYDSLDEDVKSSLDHMRNLNPAILREFESMQEEIRNNMEFKAIITIHMKSGKQYIQFYHIKGEASEDFAFEIAAQLNLTKRAVAEKGAPFGFFFEILKNFHWKNTASVEEWRTIINFEEISSIEVETDTLE